jgi:hypothetical protein
VLGSRELYQVQGSSWLDLVQGIQEKNQTQRDRPRYKGSRQLDQVQGSKGWTTHKGNRELFLDQGAGSQTW